MASRAVTVAVAIIIIVIIVFAVYAALTYPRPVLTIPVSFTAGIDQKNAMFDQSSLDRVVQVQVSVQNGAALWRAQILNGSSVIWSHTASLGEQQSYNSGWIPLQSGQYNFAFGVIGGGSLDATVTLSSKGGFW